MVGSNVGMRCIAPCNEDQSLTAGALLKISGMTFGYGHQPLLYDVHLHVHRGEMVGLLGPNGSGKTTLLRLMSGVLSPQQGEIILQDRTLQQWGRRAVAQYIAVVPQEVHMPFAFTVEQIVSMGRMPFTDVFGLKKKYDRVIVQDALLAAGIVPLAQRIFNELSGGERQRVVIAMALAQQPTLLLLDEPTSHLDIRHQIDTLELVQKLNRERNVTVVAAIHDLNLASRYFPRLILFQRGVVADAGPTEVLESGLLQRVYGVNVQVGILRGTEHLSVLPPINKIADSEHKDHFQPKVHVMAGGGSGELMMRALADAHIPFVAGALNIGDSDANLALRLASNVITEQPYSPISPETLAQVRASLAQVSILILCPTPIGPGNIALLQDAVSSAQHGLVVVLLAPLNVESADASGGSITIANTLLQRTGIAERDYTCGKGVQLMEQLLQAGAIVVESVAEAIEVVKQAVNNSNLI